MTEFEKLRFNFTIILYPDILLEPIHIEKGDNFNLKKVKDYNLKLYNIASFLDKISKYPIYFKCFFPQDEKISKFEALEHHIHAYIQDLYAFKEKIKTFINLQKKDLKKIHVNPDLIDKNYSDFAQAIEEIFDHIKDIRDPHVHYGSSFLDENIVEGRGLEALIQNSELKKYLTEYAKNELPQRIEKNFTISQNNWIEISSQHVINSIDLLDLIISETKQNLFTLLDFKEIDLESLRTSPSHTPPSSPPLPQSAPQ